MTKSSNSGWVHCLQDYVDMFALDEQDLKRKILDYPAKISCFNAEMHAKGCDNVVSADPKYDLSPLDMVKHVGYVIQDLSESLDCYVDHLQGEGEQEIENLLNVWNQYAQQFLADYSDGLHTRRYQMARMPSLPFEDSQFELALCPDILLTENGYSMVEVVSEVCRVAKEVRIFPLLDDSGEIAEELGPVMLALQQSNLGLEVKQVAYKLHKKNNAMLRIWAKECVVD